MKSIRRKNKQNYKKAFEDKFGRDWIKFKTYLEKEVGLFKVTK